MSDSFCNKITNLQSANLLRKESLSHVLSSEFAKFLRSSFLKNTSKRLPFVKTERIFSNDLQTYMDIVLNEFNTKYWETAIVSTAKPY